MQKLQAIPWGSAKTHIERLFPSQQELSLLDELVAANKRDSKLLQTIHAICSEGDSYWHEVLAENPLLMNIRSVELISEMQVEELTSISLRLFALHGFQTPENSDLSAFIKVSPLQPILAFADCFPAYAELLPPLIAKQSLLDRTKKRDSQAPSLPSLT